MSSTQFDFLNSPKKEIAKFLILLAIGERKLPFATPLSESQIDTIVNGYLPADRKISLSPIRYAISTLADDGLLQVVPQVATFVIPISYSDVKEIQKARMVFECLCVKKLARSQDSIEKLIELNQGLSVISVTSGLMKQVEYANLDFAFHKTIVESAGYGMTFGSLLSKMQSRFFFISLTIAKHYPLENATEHDKIVEALRNRDSRRASVAMKDHLWSAARKWAKIQIRSSRT